MPKKEPEEVSEDPNVVFEFRGIKFVFPRDRDEWPTRAIQALSKRKYADGVELVLGGQQWDLLNEIAPKYKDFFEFINEFAEFQAKECTGG